MIELTEDEQARKAARLAEVRAWCDAIEADPNLPIPEGFTVNYLSPAAWGERYDGTIKKWVHAAPEVKREGLARLLRAARRVGYRIEKGKPNEQGQRAYSLRIRQLLATEPASYYWAYAGQITADAGATCERVQVGVEKVTRPIMVQTGEIVVEEPVYEWRCTEGPLVLGDETIDDPDA